MGKRWRAFFVAVEHSDEHVHRCLPCQFVVLIHTRPMWTAGTPLVLHHENILGHAKTIFLNPVSDFMVKAEDRIRALLPQPAMEKGFVHPRFADLEERFQAPRHRQLALPDFVTSTETVLDQGVDPRVQHKAWALASEFKHFLKGPQGDHVMIHTGEGQAWFACSDSGDDHGELSRHWLKRLWQAVLIHQADQDATRNASSAKNLAQPLAAQIGLMDPKLIQLVAQLSRSLTAAFNIKWNRGMPLEGHFVAVRVDQCQRALKPLVASRMKPRHQLRNDRIFLVAHVLRCLGDSCARAFGNLRTVSQGLRDGVLGHSASFGQILHGDWFHVGNITVM